MADGPFELSGAVTVVTGATRGIGRQVATTFGRGGARLVLVGRTGTDTPHVVLPGSTKCRAGWPPRG